MPRRQYSVSASFPVAPLRSVRGSFSATFPVAFFGEDSKKTRQIQTFFKLFLAQAAPAHRTTPRRQWTLAAMTRLSALVATLLGRPFKRLAVFGSEAPRLVRPCVVTASTSSVLAARGLPDPIRLPLSDNTNAPIKFGAIKPQQHRPKPLPPPPSRVGACANPVDVQPPETVTCDGDAETFGNDCYMRAAASDDDVPEDEPQYLPCAASMCIVEGRACGPVLFSRRGMELPDGVVACRHCGMLFHRICAPDLTDITNCGCNGERASSGGGGDGSGTVPDGDDEAEDEQDDADPAGDEEAFKECYQRKYAEAVMNCPCPFPDSPAKFAWDSCLASHDGKRKAPPLFSKRQAEVWEKAMEERGNIKARVRAAVSKSVKDWRAGRVDFQGRRVPDMGQKRHDNPTGHNTDPEYDAPTVGRAPNMAANEIARLVHCLHVPENRRAVEMLLDGKKTRAALDDKHGTLQPMVMTQSTFNDPHFKPENYFTSTGTGGDAIRSVDPAIFSPRRVETLEAHFINCRALVTRCAAMHAYVCGCVCVCAT